MSLHLRHPADRHVMWALHCASIFLEASGNRTHWSFLMQVKAGMEQAGNCSLHAIFSCQGCYLSSP